MTLEAPRRPQRALAKQGGAQPVPEVLSFVTESYVDLARVWLDQYARVAVGPALIMCMDERSHEELRRVPAAKALRPGERYENAPNRRAFWVRRLELVHERLGLEGGIIHSDLDAFWLGDVRELLGRIPYDLAFSVEHGLPKDVARRRGFVLCCGLFAAKWSCAVDGFFEQWLKRTRECQDDQLALNRLVDENLDSWREEKIGQHVMHVCELDLGAGPVRIVALPEALLAREHAFDSPDAIIAHPFFERHFHRSFVELYEFWFGKAGAAQIRPLPAQPRSPALKRRDEAALRVLEEAVAAGCVTAEMRSHLGVLYSRCGAHSQALEHLGSAVAAGCADQLTCMALFRSARSVGADSAMNGALRLAASAEPMDKSVMPFAGAAVRCLRFELWPAVVRQLLTMALTKKKLWPAVRRAIFFRRGIL